MSRPETVPDHTDAVVTIDGPLRHLCPHVDEVDNGAVTIQWRCTGQTIELHSLAAYLGEYATERISHETITQTIRDHLATLDGITDVTVATTWDTAGLAVTVKAVR